MGGITFESCQRFCYLPAIPSSLKSLSQIVEKPSVVPSRYSEDRVARVPMVRATLPQGKDSEMTRGEAFLFWASLAALAVIATAWLWI